MDANKNQIENRYFNNILQKKIINSADTFALFKVI